MIANVQERPSKLPQEFLAYVGWKIPDTHAASRMVAYAGCEFEHNGKRAKLAVRMDSGPHNEIMYKFTPVYQD